MKNKINLFYHLFKNRIVYNSTYRNIILLLLLSTIGITLKISNNFKQIHYYFTFVVNSLKTSLNQNNSLVYTWSLFISLIIFIIWFLLWKNTQYVKKEFWINFSNKIINSTIIGVVLFSLINISFFILYCTLTQQDFMSLIDIQKNHFAILVLIFQLILIRIYTIKKTKISILLRIGIIIIFLYLMFNWKTTYKMDIPIAIFMLICSLLLSWILNKQRQKKILIPYKYINSNWKMIVLVWFRQNKLVTLSLIPTFISIIMLVYFNNKNFSTMLLKLSNKNITKENLLISISISIVVMQIILLLTKNIKKESQKIYFVQNNQIIYKILLIFNILPTIFLFFINGNEGIILELKTYIGIILLLNVLFCLIKRLEYFTPIITTLLYVILLMLIIQKFDVLINLKWLHKYQSYMILISYIVIFSTNVILYIGERKWKK